MHKRRRTLTAFMLAGVFLLAAATSAEVPRDPNRRSVELTFLKSLPGQRGNLKQFIVLNWFATDKKAKEQGLMDAFTVVDTGTEEGPWNVLVTVCP